MSTVYLLLILLPGSAAWEPLAATKTLMVCRELAVEWSTYWNKRTTWEQPEFMCVPKRVVR